MHWRYRMGLHSGAGVGIGNGEIPEGETVVFSKLYRFVNYENKLAPRLIG